MTADLLKVQMQTAWYEFQLSLGWMFLHSLWIGGIIALVVMFMEQYVPRMDNRQRHFTYRFALLFFLVGCGILLWPWEWVEILRPDTDLLSLGVSQFALVFLVNSIWLFGFLWFLKRHIESQLFIRKVCMNAGMEFPVEWVEIFERIRGGLGNSKYVSMIHSRKIKSAFVYGIFKPVIVIPTCWVNRLEYHEAECILAHELSHLRAGDHFFNALCNFCDMVFFFNPAVRYLTARLRFQRELCADDLAASQLTSIHAYASLILKLGENPGLVLNPQLVGFGSEKNQLLKRVRNLLKLPVQTEFSGRLRLSICFAIALWAITFLLGYQEMKSPSHRSGVVSNEFCQDQLVIKYKPGNVLSVKEPELKTQAQKRSKAFDSDSLRNHESLKEEFKNAIAEVIELKDANVSVDTQITIVHNKIADTASVSITQTLATPSGKQEYYWEAKLMESRQDLKKWIQVITEEALQSNMKNIRFISDHDRMQRSRDNKVRIIIMDQHRNISVFSRYAEPGSADQSVIN